MLTEAPMGFKFVSKDCGSADTGEPSIMIPAGPNNDTPAGIGLRPHPRAVTAIGLRRSAVVGSGPSKIGCPAMRIASHQQR